MEKDKEDHKKGEEVIINRLRAEYTNISHGYLMREDEPYVLPVCAKCHNTVLSVKRVLLECPSVRDKRMILGAEL